MAGERARGLAYCCCFPCICVYQCSTHNVLYLYMSIVLQYRSPDTISAICESEDAVNAALDKAGIPRILSASEKRIAEMKALRRK